MSSTLVIGGARSGKSSWAIRYSDKFEHKLFLATASAIDHDMKDRIQRHQEERGEGWETIETGRKLVEMIQTNHTNQDCIVIDCLTVWTAIIMNDSPRHETIIHDSVHPLVETIQHTDTEIVIVTNEVGMGVHPEYESGRKYRDLLGKVNQEIANVCDNMLLFVAGIPVVVKGEIPGGE